MMHPSYIEAFSRANGEIAGRPRFTHWARVRGAVCSFVAGATRAAPAYDACAVGAVASAAIKLVGP